MSHFSFVPASDAAEITDDVRRLLDELSSELPADQRATSGEYRPGVDVFETESNVEVTVDVPGVPRTALKVAFRSDILVIVGVKPAPPAVAAQYHLVERAFGRFVRAVRLSGAFDLGAARARIENGALCIVLPKISDRRGRVHTIPIDAAPVDSARGAPPAS